MSNIIKDIIGREQKVISYASPDDALIRRLVINSIELSTGRRRLEKAYNALRDLNINDHRVWKHVFPLLDIHLNYDQEKLKNWNIDGPVVVIANHPFGVADGMALGFVLSQISADFSLVVNEVLCREKVLGKFFLPIDFRDTKSALSTNINTRKAALEKLKNGGSIGIFPSGGVSTTPKLWKKTAIDLEWKKFVNKLVLQKGVSVLPIFFEGQNSRSFQVASHIHPNLRLALLLNELDRKRGKSINMVIGDLIGTEELSKISRNDMLSFLKEKTFELAIRH